MNTDKFKQLLEAEKISLENDLKKVGRENPDRPGEWEVTPTGETDVEFREDIADQMEEMDEREEVELNLEQRYENITRALEKIAKGTYGLCEISGEPIEEDRLEANPAARTCKAHREEGDRLN
jgi:DnaK suppressor protein